MQTAFAAAIDSILAEWGQVCSLGATDLTAALETLYRAELEFPPAWPAHRREAFIAHHADLDAGELATELDDLIDTVTNDYGLRYGVLPHHEDAAELIDDARRNAIHSHVEHRLIYELPDEIGYAVADDPGRGDGSMTACGPAQRCRLRPHR